MRPIDADVLRREVGKLWETEPDGIELCKEIMKAVNHAPTIDTVPVEHGRWLEDEKTYPGPDLSNYVCSSCKRVGGTWIKGLKPENLFTYCPWCGAKMGGERKDT